MKRFERVNHFLRVHVVGDLIEITAVRVDGTPIETITWGEAPKREAPTVAAIPSTGAAVSAAAPSPAPRNPARGRTALVMIAILGLLVAGAAGGVWRLVRGR